MYTEGVEISVIVRSLNVPYETVRSWIRAEGKKAIKKIEHKRKVILEKGIEFKKAGIDEMWTFVNKKDNPVWIWTAVFDEKYKFFWIGKEIWCY